MITLRNKFDALQEIYTATPCITKNTIDKWTKGWHLLFPKKGDFEIAKNYWVIALTSIAAKIYNALRLKRIKPKI